jgi:Fe-S cluster assembly iron-binding protein IscA
LSQARYNFSIAHSESSNVRLVVDPNSALFVSGSVLDYSQDLQKSGFKVTNLNAVAHSS